jgi:hypothetical protein
MKKTIYLIAIILMTNCNNAIKNTDAQVEVENGTEVEQVVNKSEPHEIEEIKVDDAKVMSKIGDQSLTNIDTLIGFWVGYFKPDTEDRQVMYVDEGYVWNKENKINISIDQIRGSIVKGHSVVAGNDRPFNGTVKTVVDSLKNIVSYYFEVAEPGDDRYDGEFVFRIVNNELSGQWTAYKDINIKHRKYNLERKTFNYNPNIMLERSKTYVNWEKSTDKEVHTEVDGDDTYEWITQKFSTATSQIYKLNASNTVLTKADVENLKKGDLEIVRNTIYARHGYSFKNQPLRVFFDAQSWYIPVHSNIKNDFTEIEKKNIALLLSFEKNAAEYYDSFGRG